MSIEKEIQERSGSVCELCSNTKDLGVYIVSPDNKKSDHSIYACATCIEQLNNPEKVDINHWRCLNDSMWSAVPAVQVVAYRMLNQLKAEGWPQDLLDQMYLDEDTLAWAKEGVPAEIDEFSIIHRDCNGVLLANGDTVVLTKDLDVKGSTFAAKRGTAVRNIILVRDNAEQIEGRVNSQQLVILTKFVKKS